MNEAISLGRKDSNANRVKVIRKTVGLTISQDLLSKLLKIHSFKLFNPKTCPFLLVKSSLFAKIKVSLVRSRGFFEKMGGGEGYFRVNSSS
jgi:hypothetical protein